MQRTLTSHLGQHEQPVAGRRYGARSLIFISLFACLLPLAGCDQFPWQDQPKPQEEETGQLNGPSVTRGRPDSSQPAFKPKPKPKTSKKPANPAPAVATTTGPEIAAEPGQPVNGNGDSTVSGDADNGTAPAGADNAVRDSGAAPDATAPDTAAPDANQIASLPSNGTDRPGGKPSDMIGRDENGIRALIGAPTKTRTEGSTTVWSYEKDGCALDLFLFYDVKTGAQRVLSYEIKPTATDNDAIQACYNKFHNV
jgi:hypothetical protein